MKPLKLSRNGPAVRFCWGEKGGKGSRLPLNICQENFYPILLLPGIQGMLKALRNVEEDNPYLVRVYEDSFSRILSFMPWNTWNGISPR